MWLVLLTTILPGQAFARKIDPEGDWIRQAMLTPALGLLFLYFASGISFLFGLSLTMLSWLLLIVNLISIAIIRSEIDLGKDPTTNTVRDTKFWGFTVIAILISMTPLLTYTRPMGVDWIGFSALTDAIIRSGGMILPSPSLGEWIYPPAFPMLAAWQAEATGILAPESVFNLGHLSFAALLLALSAIGERIGASHWLILAMLLAPALFAKTLDSGYPTIASQLGLIVGLSMLYRKINWSLFLFTAITVAMIHPTGLIYYCTLTASILLLEKQKFTFSDKTQIGLIVIAIIVVILALLPAFNGKAVFAEYGWQGGSPFVMYAGLLAPLAIWAGWDMRHSYEGRLFILWIIINWLLTSIYLFDGLAGIPLLSMLSYILYSMSMHAFHIPMACLVSLKLAKTELFSDIKITRSIMIVTILISAIAQQCLLELSEHDELHAQTSGDFILHSWIENLPDDSIVYSENIHWGHSWNTPESLGITSVPTLGILHQTYSIQNVATTAIVNDDYTKISEIGITHAITSPLGTMQWEIASSNHWKLILEIEGSMLWELSENDSLVSTFVPIIGDNMRPDPWREHRFRDPFNMGNDRFFMNKGDYTIQLNQSNLIQACVSIELIGDVSISVEELEYSGSGWVRACPNQITDTITISMESESEYWLNPSGASGRSDRFVDETGIRLHWLEIITIG
ncbi:MAG: hypothetical protein QGI21_04755 [Candidatus Poseidoniaceae archaeon]|jgi:hypothetical protein|nr:hypothetical protein [Candidatus Poseidoniaceae archaeon]